MLKKTGNNIYSDECYTPKEAVLPLLPFLFKYHTYYECTANISSSIVDVMQAEGYNINPSMGSDFLLDPVPQDINVIITNPPYSKKDLFIRKCYQTGKPFALLLPVSSLQGRARGKMFAKHGIDLLVLNNRIDFTGKGAPHFGVAWFCYKILPERLIFI